MKFLLLLLSITHQKKKKLLVCVISLENDKKSIFYLNRKDAKTQTCLTAGRDFNINKLFLCASASQR